MTGRYMLTFEMDQHLTLRVIPPNSEEYSNFKVSFMKQKPVYRASRSRYQEKPELLGETADSRSGLRHGPKESVTSHRGRKNAVSQGHQSQLEGAPPGQKWTTLASSDASPRPCQCRLVPPRLLPREITRVWLCPAGLPGACFPTP